MTILDPTAYTIGVNFAGLPTGAVGEIEGFATVRLYRPVARLA